MIITDELLLALSERFNANSIRHAEDWEETCLIKGTLRVLDWLKDKQEELNEAAMTTGDHQVVVHEEDPLPRIVGQGVRNAGFLNDS